VTADEVDTFTASLAGTRRQRVRGVTSWRFHGRLVVRHLDDQFVVIRTGFEARDALVAQRPHVFTVPDHLSRHMMVVADLLTGQPDDIETAVRAAYELQRSAD